VSRTTLWRMVQAGAFPQPVRITERNRGFLLEAVEAWMKARTDAQPEDVILDPANDALEREAIASASRFDGGCQGLRGFVCHSGHSISSKAFNTVSLCAMA